MKHDENQISSAKAAATDDALDGAELERIATWASPVLVDTFQTSMET